MVWSIDTPSVPDYDRLHYRDPGRFAAPPQLKELRRFYSDVDRLLAGDLGECLDHAPDGQKGTTEATRARSPPDIPKQRMPSYDQALSTDVQPTSGAGIMSSVRGRSFELPHNSGGKEYLGTRAREQGKSREPSS